jgi:hypothetical protein
VHVVGDPWNASLHGSTLEEIPAEAHRQAAVAADDQHGVVLGAAFRTRIARSHSEHLAFAVEVAKQMARPASDFARPAGGPYESETAPSGPFGRLEAPFDKLSRSAVARRVHECIDRGLLTRDLKLTTKADELRLRVARRGAAGTAEPNDTDSN